MLRSIFTRDKPGTSDPAVAEALADAELVYGDSVPTGTYLDMTANLPVVDPLKVQAPVLLVRGEHDGIASEEDLLTFYAKLPNPDRQFAILAGMSHSVALGTNRHQLWHVMHAFLAMPPRRDVMRSGIPGSPWRRKSIARSPASGWQTAAMTYLLPPLNAVRAFEAAARHLSFKLAAHELHVTPGAISQHVKALEERLGLQLFDRLHRQLVLTHAGLTYLTPVREAFRRLAAATSELKPDGVISVLNVGIHGGFEFDRLRAELQRFRDVAVLGRRAHQPAGRLARAAGGQGRRRHRSLHRPSSGLSVRSHRRRAIARVRATTSSVRKGPPTVPRSRCFDPGFLPMRRRPSTARKRREKGASG